MQRRMFACALAALGLTFGLTAPAQAASSVYYYKYFATSGTISTWYTNDNSWGVTAPNGTGFAAMVDGEDWGTWSPVTDLPKKLDTISSSNTTWFSQTASPASGAGYDATYDIFIDPTYAPTTRNSLYEIMIWVGYRAPNQPLSDSYNSSGQAVPYATNVSLDGRNFNLYVYHWSGGGITMTYEDTANPGWFSGSLTPFFNYGENHGWYSSGDYLTSIMAGWEFGHGSYTATSWGVAGF